jgi:hypothetical protein
VVCDGVQWDGDNLPAHVDRARCVPADVWFAKNAAGAVVAEPAVTAAKQVDRVVEPARKGR